MKKPKIVLCGSMKVKDEIIKIKDELEKRDYEVLLPIECMQGLPKEIAFAFYFRKNTYVLNDYYEPYLDELEGWKVKALHKNLNNLKR